MATAGKESVVVLGLGAIGTLLVWSGIKGKNWTAVLRDLIAGQSPTEAGKIPIVSAPIAGQSLIVGSAPGITDTVKGNYSEAQVRALWISLGGSSSTAQNAACHAMQESSGNPGVESPNPDGGANVGLFQLDTKGVGSGHTAAQLKNAMLNTQITIKATDNGRNWSSWATPGC